MVNTSLTPGQKAYISKFYSNNDRTKRNLQDTAKRFNVTVTAILDHLDNKNEVKELKVEQGDLTVRQLEKKLLEAHLSVRNLTKANKQAIHSELIFDELRTAVNQNCKPLGALPKAHIVKETKTRDTVHEDLMMHVSDEHADQIVLPHRVNGLEEYNFNVALRRAEVYVEKVIRFTQYTMANYEFDTLYVPFYGDHSNGEIHKGIEVNHFKNIFASGIAVGQMHALMLRDLAPYFKKIIAIYVPGNHGRQANEKEYAFANRNVDYLIAEVARAYCRDIKNIDFVVPDAYSVNINIQGYVFNISHGDDIKSSMGIPWYGIERRTNRLTATHVAKGACIHYKVLGHFHKASSIQDNVGETLINGSWKATDEYIYNSFGTVAEPTQWIHGINKDHGITWRLPVHLRTPGDNKGPTRYNIEMASKVMEGLVNNGKR
jgi:predicted DNA-binding protein YlxM (UPF0122 family)